MTTITPLGGSKYAVPSESTEGVIYEVDVAAGICTCPAGKKRKCKHQRWVAEWIRARDRGGLGLDIDEPAGPNGETKGKDKTLKLGYRLDEVASALQKEIRRGDQERAVYWALILADSAAFYCWKRILITAAEDIGMASPETVFQVCMLANAWRQCKEHSWYVSSQHIVMAIMLLCRAPKSTEVEDLGAWTLERIRRGEKLEVLPEYLDAHTKAGKDAKVGWDKWFETRHRLFGIPVNNYTIRLWSLVPAWDPFFERVTHGEEAAVKCRDCGKRFAFGISGDPGLMDHTLLEHLREHAEGGPEHRGAG